LAVWGGPADADAHYVCCSDEHDRRDSPDAVVAVMERPAELCAALATVGEELHVPARVVPALAAAEYHAAVSEHVVRGVEGDRDERQGLRGTRLLDPLEADESRGAHPLRDVLPTPHPDG
ncbi:hypothetical protein, partial [Clavibacter michiganensis]|uniref:hypothetical protein n=1 Tax=Clavibacter michiganensis TaxID=28447 RepID=UPI00293107A6